MKDGFIRKGHLDMFSRLNGMEIYFQRIGKY